MNVTILNKIDAHHCRTHEYYTDITGLQFSSVLYKDKISLRQGESNIEHLQVICPHEMNPLLLNGGDILAFDTPPKCWCKVKYRHNYREDDKTVYVLELVLERMYHASISSPELIQFLNNNGDQEYKGNDNT